jgi:hypothetical protein
VSIEASTTTITITYIIAGTLRGAMRLSGVLGKFES